MKKKKQQQPQFNFKKRVDKNSSRFIDQKKNIIFCATEEKKGPLRSA